MHRKSDSDVTSVEASSPARPLYYVQSPSNHEPDKMSYGSSPFGSPGHQYHCSPIHHSRESSTSRFSASLKTTARNAGYWKKLQRSGELVEEDEDEEYDEEDEREKKEIKRFYVVCFVLSFVVLFSVFSLILWAASTSYPPEVYVKRLVFEKLNVQSGMDESGVATDMLTLNSTIKILYRNTGTFFGVDVKVAPVRLSYYQRNLATGPEVKFHQNRKTQRTVITSIESHQLPLYGGVPGLISRNGRIDSISVPLNLTIGIRSRAYVLGKLVKPKFYRTIRCQVTIHGSKLGKPVNLTNACVHHN
ncbi:uncharacterized protein LOC141671087 [Apium graveolens]|uniref:uncharacterized protein LOC141671087 n=1 Tax=Apium graveolens TaxID=4045 RepID=UPI003D7934EA